MSNEILIIFATAAWLGFFHTLIGPDHYIPFIVMSKARQWSMRKTMLVTALCGTGHVSSSIILGLILIITGKGLSNLLVIDEIRGNAAILLMISFGTVYLIWGLRKAYLNKPHHHIHTHEDGTMHTHEHRHHSQHNHIHESKDKNITPWVLFTIFVLGPCEAMIPLIMYPYSVQNNFAFIVVILIFSITTLLTMMSATYFFTKGIRVINFGKAERYSHAIAGGTILISGITIQLLGI